MDCSTPGLPVHHQLLELAQTHVRRVGDASNHLILCHPLLLLRDFSNESTLRIRWPKYWSFSFSINPSKTQDWSLLGWTGWISLQSKGLARVFSNTTLQKHQFFGAAFFIVQHSHPYMTTGKTFSSAHSVVSDSLWPHGLQHSRFPSPSPTPEACSNSRPSSRWCIQPSHPLSSPSPAFNLFQQISSLHQVAKVLDLQLQYQSFQCIFRVDFL